MIEKRRVSSSLAVLSSFVLLVAAACGGGDEGGNKGAAQEQMSFAWGAEPPSLDPGFATDTTSANVLLNIMDPLVKLEGPNLDAKPNLAESWDISNGGKTYTIHMRKDGKWTNGDPVTAHDFEFSWKRLLDPKLATDYAYIMYGIVGAEDYNSCKKDCDALKDKVGVKAVDDYTLKVDLTSPQPWFPQLLAHQSFFAEHPATVKKFGDKWTDPQNIVTNGPFKLVSWRHDAEIDLAKWDGWRNADDVTLTRVNGRIITEGTTAVQAFESGEVDALDSGLIPPSEVPRFKGQPDYYQSPALGTYIYAFNVKNVPDVHQRRAMSLAIDRNTIVKNITQEGEKPAADFTPAGIRGFSSIEVKSPWAPAAGNMAKAKEEMAKAKNPNKDITFFFNNAPGHKEIAVAVQAQWKELGIHTTLKQQEWAQFLDFIGPPPNSAVDIFRYGWIYDIPDAINGLEIFTCDSGNNSTNWCNKKFDSLYAQARQTPDDNQRYKIYRQMEQVLYGPNGDVPAAPIYWYTNTTLRKPDLQNFSVSPQTFIDFTKIKVGGD